MYSSSFAELGVHPASVTATASAETAMHFITHLSILEMGVVAMAKFKVSPVRRGCPDYSAFLLK